MSGGARGSGLRRGATGARPDPRGHVGGRRHRPRRAGGPGGPGAVPEPPRGQPPPGLPQSREPGAFGWTARCQRAAEERMPREGGPGARVGEGVRRDAQKSTRGWSPAQPTWGTAAWLGSGRAASTASPARCRSPWSRRPAPDRACPAQEGAAPAPTRRPAASRSRQNGAFRTYQYPILVSGFFRLYSPIRRRPWSRMA